MRYNGHNMMKAKTRRMKTQSTLSIRATISFPADLYETLAGIAKSGKVSLAWIVRAAAENYVAEKTKKGGKDDVRRGD